MATKKEIKELLKEYKKFLNDINNCIYFKESSLNELKDNIIFLNNGSFQNYASSYLTKKKIDESLKETIENKIFIPLYKISNIDKELRIINKYKEDYEKDIKENIKLAKKLTSTFSFFLSKIKKKEAETSYSYLYTNKLNSRYNEVISSLSRCDLSTPTLDKAKEDYNKNLVRYRRYYLEIVPSLSLKENKIKELNKIEDFVSSLDKDINSIKEKEEVRKEKIKEYLIIYKKKETLKKLKEIDINELNKLMKVGKASTLIKAGITSFYELNNQSVFSLSQINGITYEKANEIKKVSNTYINNIYNSTYIKLSIDNKEKENIDVIKSIYSYKKGNIVIKKIEKIKEDNKDYFSYMNHLRRVHNGEYFPILNEGEIYNYRLDYETIKKFINSNFKDVIAKGIAYFNKEYKDEEVLEDFKNNSVSYFNFIEKLVPGILSSSELESDLSLEIRNKIDNLSLNLNGLNCELRKYQEYGVKYILSQKHVLLGDEMGLGKTIEAIATMVHLKNEGGKHFLVVCPASLIINWIKEINKFSNFTAIKIHGKNKASQMRNWIKNGGIAVTSYETSKILTISEGNIYSMLVVDEAHYIKNPEARRTEIIKDLSLHFDNLLFMSGTPLENNVEEMVNIISILDRETVNKIRNGLSLLPPATFRKKVSSVYYRRKREQVLNELPTLIEKDEWCELNEFEESRYLETLYSKNYMAIRRLSFNIDDLNKSTKLNRIVEIIEEAKLEKRKVIIFSFFRDTLTQVHDYLKDDALPIINGSLSLNKRNEILENFEKAKDGSVLCLQIMAGGSGLNIQCASVVIICEPQLKPSTELQAISRSYRMGQVRSVEVFRLLASDTIEERINEILKEKQSIFDNYADKSISAEKDIKELEINEKTLSKMVEEEIKKHEKEVEK